MNKSGNLNDAASNQTSEVPPCPRCGQSLLGDELFCPSCLRRLRDMPEQEPTEERLTYEEAMSRARPIVPTGVKWVTVVVLLSMALFMVWYGWIRPTGKDYLSEGDILYRQGRFDQALALYQKAAEQEPDLAQAHLMIGWASYRMAEDNEALSAFQRALLLDPSLGEAYLGLGKTQYYLGNYEAARQNLIKARQLVPERRDVYAYLGGSYLEDNRAADAIQLLEKATQLNPVDAKAFLDLGRARYSLGDYSEAIGALVQATQLAPGDLEAQRYLAEAYQDAGRYKEAASTWKGLVKADPDDLWARVSLGRCLYETDEYQGAAETLADVIDIVREDVPLREAYLYLGWTEYQQGQYDKALHEFQTANALQAAQPDSYAGLGMSLEKMGRCAEAVPALEYALSQKPDLADVRQSLELCKSQVE